MSRESTTQHNVHPLNGLCKCCGILGAKVAYVGSDQEFYKAIGFKKVYVSEGWMKYFQRLNERRLKLIKLRDSVRIRTTPEHVFKWLEAMPQEYKSWHPDHVACRLIHGSMLQPGSEIECKEYLHGKLHVMRLRATRIDPGRQMEYEIAGLGKGAFEVIPRGDEIEFVAELGLGSDAPIIGHLVDTILRVLFGCRLGALKQHMQEEGQNLKKILEPDWRSSNYCKEVINE